MIKVINEAFNKNFPSWFSYFLTHSRKFGKDVIYTLSKKYDIDLKNVNAINVTDPNDPGLKDPDNIVVVDLASSSSDPELTCYVYHPLPNGSRENIIDVTLRSENAKRKLKASRRGVKNLFSIADHLVLISISENKKAYKDRYEDPRNDYAGEYAGQYFNNKFTYDNPYTKKPGKVPDDKWHVDSWWRDKSGYATREPEEIVGSYYKFNLDNIDDVFDRYYNKLSKAKSKIGELNSRVLNSEDASSSDLKTIKSCGSWLNSLYNTLSQLRKGINRIIKEIGKESWESKKDELGLTDEELFQYELKHNPLSGFPAAVLKEKVDEHMGSLWYSIKYADKHIN